MSTWIERLRDERVELNHRTELLRKFLSGQRPESCHIEQWAMMQAQLSAMEDYLQILDLRLQRVNA
jgi:hypothetical protein